MPSKEARINNLQKANIESHKIVEESLKEALFSLLATKDINDISVTELVNKAGVSRAVFYKHYYLVKDVLKKDVKDITNQVQKRMSDSLYNNWLHILTVTYERRDKLLLLLKADMGMEILTCFNDLLNGHSNKELFLAWNGIVFNVIVDWAKGGFEKTPEQLAETLTNITKPLYDRH